MIGWDALYTKNCGKVRLIYPKPKNAADLKGSDPEFLINFFDLKKEGPNTILLTRDIDIHILSAIYDVIGANSINALHSILNMSLVDERSKLYEEYKVTFAKLKEAKSSYEELYLRLLWIMCFFFIWTIC